MLKITKNTIISHIQDKGIIIKEREKEKDVFDISNVKLYYIYMEFHEDILDGIHIKERPKTPFEMPDTLEFLRVGNESEEMYIDTVVSVIKKYIEENKNKVESNTKFYSKLKAKLQSLIDFCEDNEYDYEDFFTLNIDID